MNGLILHCGAGRVDRAALEQVPTPEATRTWRPVSHHQAATLAINEAGRRGYQISREEYGLNPAGTKMFGVLRFAQEGTPERSRCLGIRNSHDKSLRLGLTVGFAVMVCDNLCFGGETTIHRKHTSGLDIEALVPAAFDKIDEQYAALDCRIEELKVEELADDAARVLVVSAAEQLVIPSCDILPVLQSYLNPLHVEFEPRTRWSLYNGFTAVAKKYSPTRADECFQRLGRMFQLN